MCRVTVGDRVRLDTSHFSPDVLGTVTSASNYGDQDGQIVNVEMDDGSGYHGDSLPLLLAKR